MLYTLNNKIQWGPKITLDYLYVLQKKERQAGLVIAVASYFKLE